MTPTLVALVAFRLGRFLLPLLGLVAVGALVAVAISERTPDAYRMPAFVGAAAAVIGLIVLFLAAFGVGRW